MYALNHHLATYLSFYLPLEELKLIPFEFGTTNEILQIQITERACNVLMHQDSMEKKWKAPRI